MPSCLAIAAPGGDVVAGDHPHPDVGALRVEDRRLGLLARRVDHADQGGQLEIGDVAEQVALGVERGRVEVAEGRGHHPVPFALHAGDGVVRLALRSASSGTLSPAASAVAARSITAGAAPFTKQRTTFLPEESVAELNVAISL